MSHSNPDPLLPAALPRSPQFTATGVFIGLVSRVAGPLLAIAVYALLAWEGRVEHPARVAAGLATLMAVWWITEALPLAITALLPLVILPLCGAYAETTKSTQEAVRKAAAGFADPALFLFLGGFILALAVERWGLHRRLALLTLRCAGTRPRYVLLSFILVTGFISLWISNTATTAMMLPIALSVAQRFNEENGAEMSETERTGFAASLVLGVAYAASIGGCGTLIGTPTNTIFRGFLEQHEMKIGFGQWMLFAVPVVLIYLVLCWWLLSRMLFSIPARALSVLSEETSPAVKSAAVATSESATGSGPMSRGERITLAIFAGTALAWLFREPVTILLGDWLPFLRNIDDTVISMAAVLVIFLTPVDIRRGVYVLDWSSARKLPWEVLLLFGGGISLSQALSSTGMDLYIGERLRMLSALPTPVLAGLLCLVIIFFSELTSNVAMMTTFAPIVLGLARELQVDPLLLLVPAALSCSYAFMLPAGTPPNAMAFATGQVSLQQMMRAGLLLNLAGGIIIPLATWTLGRWVLGIRI